MKRESLFFGQKSGFCTLQGEYLADEKHLAWAQAVDQGRFGNIRNNPVLQEVTFTPVNARFFRFTAVKEVGGNNAMSAAEITVLPAPDAASKP